MKRGMTLIELLLYTALLSIILTILYQLFIISSFQRINEVVEDELYINARIIMRELNQSVKNATAITVPAMGASGSTLSLSGGQIVYSVNAQGVFIKTEGAATTDVGNGEALVESIAFYQLGPSTATPTVKVVFTLLGRHLQETGERRETFQTAITMR